MNFHIADSFTSALAKLNGQEQKQAKTAAFDLQLNPAHPGLQMHRLTSGRDPNFWSVRVNRDIRIIIHKTAASFMLAYVDHHDHAYDWASRRRIEAHPRTGSIQIVEVHERIEDAGPLFAQAEEREAAQLALQPDATPVPAIFEALTEEELLNVGTPQDWLADVRTWSEERFFQMSDRLPAEVAEALLEYAATGILPSPVTAPADPFEHPDTLRRVQTITTEEDLRLALDFPWDKWSVYLHPSQREVVERTFSGPARVTGTAGTGKTIVALHRASRAVRSDPQARVLLATFSRPLANNLKAKLAVLLGSASLEMDRVTIASFEDAAGDLHQLQTGRKAMLASSDVQKAAIERAIADTAYSELPARFVLAEWRNVVDTWHIADLDSYASVPRIGRRGRLGLRQREGLWPVFERARGHLAARGLQTPSQLFASVADAARSNDNKPFTQIIIDEAQDLSVGALRMMGALAAGPDALFFAGDLGQRIFQHPFSWLSLGVDVRGRSSSLRINYRTSRQIRQAADQLLPRQVQDVDGVEEDRSNAQSVFEGPSPQIIACVDEAEEVAKVSEWLIGVVAEGVEPAEIGLIVRSDEYLSRARNALSRSGLEGRQLTEEGSHGDQRVAIGTMHLAKGLEFKAVAVMACDDEALPLQERIDHVADEDELREVFETERHLFYVACTRARDCLFVSGIAPMSEFVTDMSVPRN